MPKSLNEIRQKKIIEMIFEKLKLLGIKDIYLTVGYKSKKIIQFLKSKKFKFKTIYIKNFRNCGSIYSWYSFYKTWNRKKISFCYIVIYFSITHLSLLKKKT